MSDTSVEMQQRTHQERTIIRLQLQTLRARQKANQRVLSNINRDKTQTPVEAQATLQAYTQWETLEGLSHMEREAYADRRDHLSPLVPVIENVDASTFFDSLPEGIRESLLSHRAQAHATQAVLDQEATILEKRNSPFLLEDVRYLAHGLKSNFNRDLLFQLPPEKIKSVLSTYYLARAVSRMDQQQRTTQWDYASVEDVYAYLFRGAVEWGGFGMFSDNQPLSREDYQELSQRIQRGEVNLQDGDEVSLREIVSFANTKGKRSSGKLTFPRQAEIYLLGNLERGGNHAAERGEEMELLGQIDSVLGADAEFRQFLLSHRSLFPDKYAEKAPAMTMPLARQITRHFKPILVRRKS